MRRKSLAAAEGCVDNENMTPHRIVVVDDENDLLENYKDLLGDDFIVEAFSNPQSFVQSTDRSDFQVPDLVITDLKMPGMDGLEMVRRIQKKKIYFPVILMSGFLDKQAALDAQDIGVFRLLEKPTPIAKLRRIIDQLMVEHEVHLVRREIRVLTSQLRELYAGIRLAVLPYIPEDVLNRMIVNAPNGTVKKSMSFEDLMEALETRLDQLLKAEKSLGELREKNYKNE
jgi:FixJ family two-component response regulator